jgi:hypothetical protein
MTFKLYIDGIPRLMAQGDLRDMFDQFGKVLSVELFHTDGADSSGIGIIEMLSLREAANAARALHRSYNEGTLLLVFPDPIKPHRSRDRSFRPRTHVRSRLASLKSKKERSPPQA